MSKFIDIHRHSGDKGGADVVLRNLYHSQTSEINTEQYVSVGLHPWHVQADDFKTNLQSVKDSIIINNVLALGEAGLDKTIDTALEIQQEAFLNQVIMAEAAGKAMIIHCVRAYNELLRIRSNANKELPWIIHWYNSSYETGADLISKGCYLSFGPMLFKESSKAFRTFSKLPLERIFLETDDSEHSIAEIYERAAHLRGISLSDLQEQIKSNFEICFRVKV